MLHIGDRAIYNECLLNYIVRQRVKYIPSPAQATVFHFTTESIRVLVMIHVIAAIEVAAGKREAFLEEFRKLVPLVHAEEGCVEYGPTIDFETNLPAQGDVRPHVVTVVEKWESIEALEAHLIAPHMVDYRGRVKEMVVETKLQILQPA